MIDQLTLALAYIQEQRSQIIRELKEFVAIPSVSADPAARPEIERGANWVANALKNLGAQQVQIFPTAGAPVVYGEMMAAGPGRPVILIYGHYDVQPADPLDLWHSPAYEPTQRGDNLYGRGVSDMKGQIIIVLKAVEALVRHGDLGVNLKFMFEGEEEIGSPNLEAFIREQKMRLTCDFSLNPDSGMLSPELPTVTYGLRGLAYFELRVAGPASDLHSGQFGGIVHNPAQALCELIAGMHDSQGRITLPGFYDKVRPLSEEERQELNRVPTGDHYYLQQTGAPAIYGEAGYTATERLGARPTLEVNGLLSGYTGEGPKTVLPAKAMAKISMRLVPDQDPEEVYQQLLQYLRKHAPASIRWEVIKMAGGAPSITDRDLPGVVALSKALHETWGVAPVFRREGGSVPVVSQIQRILGVESVIAGFGLPDDNLHAPNEKLHLPTFYRGIEAIVRFLKILGEG